MAATMTLQPELLSKVSMGKQLEIEFPKFLFEDGTPYYDKWDCKFCKDFTRPCFGYWYCSKKNKKKKPKQ